MNVDRGLIELSLNEVIYRDNQNVYPYNLEIFRDFKKMSFHPKVTFFTGENGSGKSTLLEAIAVNLGFNAEGGSKNFGFSTRASHSDLHKAIRIAKGVKKFKDGYFLRGESFFNVSTEIENLDKDGGGPPIINAYGGKSLHEQSHGESCWSLFIHRFMGNGLYILDEPEAALSPTRQLAFLIRLNELVSQDSQFMIATHSPIILAFPDSVTYEFTDDRIEKVLYTDTSSYQTYRRFLTGHKQMLADLFGDNL